MAGSAEKVFSPKEAEKFRATGFEAFQVRLEKTPRASQKASQQPTGTGTAQQSTRQRRQKGDDASQRSSASFSDL